MSYFDKSLLLMLEEEGAPEILFDLTSSHDVLTVHGYDLGGRFGHFSLTDMPLHELNRIIEVAIRQPENENQHQEEDPLDDWQEEWNEEGIEVGVYLRLNREGPKVLGNKPGAIGWWEINTGTREMSFTPSKDTITPYSSGERGQREALHNKILAPWGVRSEVEDAFDNLLRPHHWDYYPIIGTDFEQLIRDAVNKGLTLDWPDSVDL